MRKLCLPCTCILRAVRRKLFHPLARFRDILLRSRDSVLRFLYGGFKFAALPFHQTAEFFIRSGKGLFQFFHFPAFTVLRFCKNNPDLISDVFCCPVQLFFGLQGSLLQRLSAVFFFPRRLVRFRRRFLPRFLHFFLQRIQSLNDTVKALRELLVRIAASLAE